MTLTRSDVEIMRDALARRVKNGDRYVETHTRLIREVRVPSPTIETTSAERTAEYWTTRATSLVGAFAFGFVMIALIAERI
jgi:site-specific recombinase